MAIVGKFSKDGEIIPLLLSEQFESANPYSLGTVICKWVNADDEQTRKVQNIVIFPIGDGTFGGIIFYWSS